MRINTSNFVYKTKMVVSFKILIKIFMSLIDFIIEYKYFYED